MKRYQVILLISAGLIVLLWVIGRVTGILQFYNFPTSSMEPTLKVGQKFFTTNLKTPKRNDIITFIRAADKYGMPDPNGKKNLFSGRVIGMEGDKLEIRSGFAYINNHLSDDTTQLKLEYFFPAQDYDKISALLKIDPENRSYSTTIMLQDQTTGLASLSFDEYHKARELTNLRRNIRTDTAFLFKQFAMKNWSVDEFGPYTIPPGYVFIMGDNRHYSQDSRYVGPIPIKDIKGVLIWKM